MKKFFWILLIILVADLSLLGYVLYQKTQQHEFEIDFFNVGQGDSALIKFSDGEKMLVDCGPDRKILSKLGWSLPFYDRTIDYLVVSHPDLDHYGGCVDVLNRYKVKHIIMNGDKKEGDSFWQVWNETMAQENTLNTIVVQPFQMTIASATLNFLSPDNSLNWGSVKPNGNDDSVVFSLKNGPVSVLFTGDMEEALENLLVQKYCSSTPVGCGALKIEYLKVGHHGSDSSSGENFIAAVGPQIAIISVGKNSYGHPSLRVVRKLERAGAEVWRTDEKGDIIISN